MNNNTELDALSFEVLETNVSFLRRLTFITCYWQKCLELLCREPRTYNSEELSLLRMFLRGFDFFKQFPYKIEDTKKLEIDNAIDQFARYMTYRVFDPKEIVTERGKLNG